MNARVSSARLLAGVAIAGVVLTSCAAGADTSAGAPAPAGAASSAAQSAHNDADVAFAQAMIPHHRQAVEMAELVAGRSQNAQVIDLAARIGGGQQPEIDTMTGWLQEWAAEVPAEDGSMGSMGGMGHGGDMGAMSGMMSPEEMQRLQGASGPEFDRMFLEMMTEHHTGAVEMAHTELEDGSDPRALALAQAIIDTQQAEIGEMESLLQQV